MVVGGGCGKLLVDSGMCSVRWPVVVVGQRRVVSDSFAIWWSAVVVGKVFVLIQDILWSGGRWWSHGGVVLIVPVLQSRLKLATKRL